MAAASASSLLPPLSSRTKTLIPQRRPSNPCWVSFPSPSRAVSVAVSSQQAVAAPKELADAIISKVKGTDRGVLLTGEGHAEVGSLAEELSKYCVEEPVKNPLIFGEWDVMYCSNPTSPGGGYRSAVGRLIFKTNEMVQAVEAPDSVRNRVSFSAFGFLDGEVSLKEDESVDHIFTRCEYTSNVWRALEGRLRCIILIPQAFEVNDLIGDWKNQGR